MKSRDHKLTILSQLCQEAEPIRLSDLAVKLESSYTNRTIRRWLICLIDEGLVEKSGHTRNARYVAIKRKGITPDEISSCFGSDSLKALDWVRRPLFERQPIAYNVKWLESYKPNESYYFSKDLRRQLHQAGLRANHHDPAGTYAHQIFNRLLIDLSYNSSRLEGNTYSLLDTERLLLYGDSAEGKLDEEKVMILNHKEAIRYVVDNAPRINVNEQTLFTLHYLLSDGLVEPQYAGKLRDHGVRIGGSTYMPFEDPKRLNKLLGQITDKAAKIKDPYEQSFFLLVHVSYLQAFIDVNKRTARLCANIPLIIQNLVPLSFNDVDVDQYMAAIIAIYELQDVHPLMDLYAYSYLRTCAAYDATVKAIGFDEIRVRYREQRRAIIRDIIDQKLIGSKMVAYIRSISKKKIPKNDQSAFMEDIMEDIEHMDQSRIAGLGITSEQLELWLKALRTNNNE